MEKLLTLEEKKYLKRVCNYLGSMGMERGEIEFEMDESEDMLEYESIRWNKVTTFSNNYRVDIPSGLTPILKKIMKHASDDQLFSSEAEQEEDLIFQKFEIEINRENKEITLYHYFSWYSRGDGSSVSWEDEEGEEIFDEWNKKGLTLLEIPEGRILTIKYNGGGDSGFIESSFLETGESVPKYIEDWCYNQLESNFGGWEINEGSDGDFVFDFNNQTIELNHTFNTEENSSDTLWEEEFGD